MTLPTDPKARKNVPIQTGCIDYFPDALAAVAAVSLAGNEQHHPGQPLHWERGKSTDEADALQRHQMERGTIDSDGHRHSAKVAWRALAQLQKEIEEAEGLPVSRGSRAVTPPVNKIAYNFPIYYSAYESWELDPDETHPGGAEYDFPVMLNINDGSRGDLPTDKAWVLDFLDPDEVKEKPLPFSVMTEQEDREGDWTSVTDKTQKKAHRETLPYGVFTNPLPTDKTTKKARARTARLGPTPSKSSSHGPVKSRGRGSNAPKKDRTRAKLDT